MHMGNRIRFFRKRAGMTQKELGMSVGFLPVSADVRIAQYESGSRKPKVELLASIAQTLGFTPFALDLSFWAEQRRRLDNGEITQEEYDDWRYNYK